MFMNLITLFALSHFITFYQFIQLSKDKQYSYLSSNIYENSQIVIDVNSGSDLAKRYLKLYEKSKRVVDELYFESHYYSSVGDFKLTYSILHSIDDKVLGFEVRVFQSGCMFQEDDSRHGSGGHFDSIEEAESDLCDTDVDVSWTAYLVFDQRGQLIEKLSDNYFEWSGH